MVQGYGGAQNYSIPQTVMPQQQIQPVEKILKQQRPGMKMAQIPQNGAMLMQSTMQHP